jgi:hypothetical protein
MAHRDRIGFIDGERVTIDEELVAHFFLLEVRLAVLRVFAFFSPFRTTTRSAPSHRHPATPGAISTPPSQRV